MYRIIVLLASVVAVCNAAPQGNGLEQVQILKQDSYVGVDGYHFSFETSDGTAREEAGELKDLGNDQKALQVQGSYRYISPDGLHFVVTYMADENGFQPTQHLDQGTQGQESYQQS